MYFEYNLHFKFLNQYKYSIIIYFSYDLNIQSY